MRANRLAGHTIPNEGAIRDGIYIVTVGSIRMWCQLDPILYSRTEDELGGDFGPTHELVLVPVDEYERLTAPLPDDVQRTVGLLRAAATMYGDEDVLAGADLVVRQSLEIARLRRMFDSARHVGVETAATEAVARPVESAAELRTTTGEGDPSGPEQELLEVDTLIWDWKEQPDLDDLAAILARHGVRLTQVDTGGDDYEIRISSADECPNLAQVLATDTGSHDDSVCGWCADLRAKREAARGRLRTLVFNAITRTLAGRTFVPLGAREDVARAVVDAIDCAADNRSAQ